MRPDAFIASFPEFNDVIIKTDAAGTITEWSSKAEELLGYTSREINGQHISTIFPSGYTIGEHILEDGREIFQRIEAISKFHNKVDLNVEHTSIKNEEGIIEGFLHLLKDTSAEDLLREKESIIRAIVDSSDDGIISITLEGIITSWNPSAAQIFGYTEEEAVGKHISIIIPEQRKEEEDFIINQIREGKKIDHFETIRITKDGREKIIDLSASFIKNKSDRIIGVSKILRDISYKKDIDEKQATLAAIVNSSDDAIISKTIYGIITSWNKSAERMFGFTEKEAVGQPISIIIPPERLEEENHIIENIRKGNKVDHFETVRMAKDGTKRNISVTISPIKDRKGIIIGASKTARDITVKMEAEKQRELYTQRLKELNQYKDEFMVMASHELKTPLTVILANLEILTMLMQDDPNRKFIEKTFKQTKKLSSLISNLFEVSKIQAGKLELNVTSFDLTILIREVSINLQETTKTHRIVYPETPAIEITADRYKIEQVLVNLIGNSIKYMTGPGDITITVSSTKEEVVVTIKDEGVGIPAKDIERIFERFYRASGSASSFAGSGIGLYISAEIIRAHSGKLWAESEIEKGSTFYFLIPVNQPKKVDKQ